MENLKNVIYTYLEKYPPSLELFYLLERAGDIYLIGGVLREYRDNGNILDLRDIDIVIDVHQKELWQQILNHYVPKKNSFGGYKLICSGLVVDIWPLNETWAYRNKIVECVPEEYVKMLPDTVFLNMDSIIYDLKKDIWYDEKYCAAMESRVLDIVLVDNPRVQLNIIRAMVLKKRYNMTYSDKLKHVISAEIGQNEDFINELLRIQEERYHKNILSVKEIEKELSCLGT